MLDLIIFNLRAADDGELIRWGNTLKGWNEPILGHFISRTTNASTEGCHIRIKVLRRTSYGLRNVEVYRRRRCSWPLPRLLPLSTHFDREPLRRSSLGVQHNVHPRHQR